MKNKTQTETKLNLLVSKQQQKQQYYAIFKSRFLLQPHAYNDYARFL